MLPPTLPLTPGFCCYRHVESGSLPTHSVRIRSRYRKLLKGMLATIGPEDTITLSAEERHGLLLLLQMPEEDVDLTVSILERLEQWGDARAVPVLKRLIREEHWYVGSDRIEVAARRCLAAVETHLLRRKQSDTLLRPTEGSNATAPNSSAAPDMGLLRKTRRNSCCVPESAPLINRAVIALLLSVGSLPSTAERHDHLRSLPFSPSAG